MPRSDKDRRNQLKKKKLEVLYSCRICKSKGTVLCIFDFGTRWRWVASFTFQPLYPQERVPRYPLDRRLDGPQSLSGRGVEERNSHSPPESNPDHPIVKPIVSRYTDWAIPAHAIFVMLTYKTGSLTTYRDASVISTQQNFIIPVPVVCKLLPWNRRFAIDFKRSPYWTINIPQKKIIIINIKIH
jgi:hypothetical protein